MADRIKYITIQEPHPLQAEVENDTHRFRVLDCGRRWGKTLSAMREAFNMLVRGYVASKGQKQRGWVVAPTFPLVREDWMTAEDLLKDAITKKRESDMRMDFDIGFLEFKSADRGADGLLGAGLNCCVVDEAKLVDKDCWEKGLRPALADKLGRCIFISTPKGRNFFYELYLRGKGNDPDWKSWKHASNTNPYFPKQEYESLRLSTPEMIFRQEYEADFLEDSASVFKNIERCLKGEFELPQLGEYYTIGCDLGRTEDFTVLTVIKNSTCQVVDVHRFNKIDWSVQKDQIKALSKKYKNSVVWIDSTGLGDPIEEDLRKSGVITQDFKFSSGSKQKLVEQLIVAIEQGLIGIPQCHETEFLIDELKSFSYEILPSGSIRYEAPTGQHDDGVMSLGLAVLGISHLLYHRKAKPDLTVKKGITADQWERFYKVNTELRKNNPFMTEKQIYDKQFVNRFRRIASMRA